jgi:hypothetical protein
MKTKIKQIASKELKRKDGTGSFTIITILTEDGQKIKAWKSQWTDANLKEGADIDIETYTKKDRDGFDETWIQTPKSSSSYRPRNLLPEAYNCALQYITMSGDAVDMKTIELRAKEFLALFNAEQKTEDKKESESEKQDEIKLDDIPF